MPVDRPTFSESWYRVADLRPRLRSTLQVHRQHYRGQMWYVIQDPGSNQFFRINTAAYQFVGMLDGERTVSEVWAACNEQLGDSAPTQPEAIQLLGQLYASNLLASELPPDAASLLNRYRKRRLREVQGYLMNLLFIRIPLIDPDHFLNRWLGVFGKVFSKAGFVIWLAIVAAGFYFVAGHWGDLSDRAQGILDTDNLPLLYLAFIFVKVFHEFGHAFACKKFGQEAGGGEVHTMGIMMLVFTPMPYVDASSAWAFRKKWHRVIVGCSGMMVELVIASIAAIVWASTKVGATPSAVNAVAYNVMFIASVSTLLFNANPLLRFDGYYILSDIIEIPNLSHRSRQYIFYIVKRYLWRVRNLRNPAHNVGEKIWFVFYGLASMTYRVFICVRILLFVADKLFIVGAVLAIAAVVAWVLTPLGKFLRYLFTNNELARSRPLAVATTVIFFLGLFVGFGMIPAPDRERIEAVAEPEVINVVQPQTDGLLVEILVQPGTMVDKDDPLLRLENRDLEARLIQLRAELAVLKVQKRLAGASAEPEAVAIRNALTGQIQAVNDAITTVETEVASLTIIAPIDGQWIAPNIHNRLGEFIKRDVRLGWVAQLDSLIVRGVAPQDIPVDAVYDDVEIRLKGRPDVGVNKGVIPGRLLALNRGEVGTKNLPSPALGYSVGGQTATSPDDRRGTQAAEPFYELRARPELPADRTILRSGQRVIVRVDMPPRPLAFQWYNSIRKLVQRRFHL